VVAGDAHRSTLRQNAFRSGIDGPPSGVATPERDRPRTDPRVGCAWMCITDVGRRSALVELGGRVGTDRGDVPVLHASAYASMPPLLMRSRNRRFGSDGDVAAMSSTTALMNPTSSMFSRPGRPQQPPTFRPCRHRRIGHDELRAVRANSFPAISSFGLLRAAEAPCIMTTAVRAMPGPGGDVEPIGPVQSTTLIVCERRALDEAQAARRTRRQHSRHDEEHAE